MKASTFRTEINFSASHPIDLKSKVLTTGSCFASEFGIRLAKNKFDILVNPFGTNYNPISIHQNLSDAYHQKLDDRFLVEQSGIWHHFDYHSQWSSQKKDELIRQIQQIQPTVKDYIEKANLLIITYGTAWTYHHKKLDHLVANCHKVPQHEFEKRLLSLDEILSSFSELHKLLNKINPAARIIITVSPVRHIKDTLVLNSVSKATLRLACHSISNQFENVEYFPSFEIMMDDLRDYRFYDRDKIHPTEEALDYISHKFSDRYFDSNTKAFIEKWHSIQLAMEHRPYHPNSPSHQHFLKDLLRKLEELKNTVHVDEEIKIIKSQIHSNA